MFANRTMTDKERADLGLALDGIMFGAKAARTATFLKLDCKPGVWLQASCDKPYRWRVMVDGKHAGLFDSLDAAKASAAALQPSI